MWVECNWLPEYSGIAVTLMQKRPRKKYRFDIPCDELVLFGQAIRRRSEWYPANDKFNAYVFGGVIHVQKKVYNRANTHILLVKLAKMIRQRNEILQQPVDVVGEIGSIRGGVSAEEVAAWREANRVFSHLEGGA